MQTGRLLLLLLLVLLAALAVVILLRRSAARREQKRVEAAVLRTDADQIAARLAGQTSFAQQAAERAEVARVEAEQRAREAARLEEEAAEQRAAAESTRREYEETLRRADDVDPDVTESSFPPVGDRDDADVADQAGVERAASDDDVERAASDDGAQTARGEDEPTIPAARTAAEDDAPRTRAERREAADSGADTGTDTGEGDRAAATRDRTAAAPVATGAAAAGAAAWAGQDGERHPDSERIASAADYRDDEPADHSAEAADIRGGGDVYGGAPVGRAAGMSDDARPDRDDSDTEREAARQPTSLDSDTSHDAESPRGEWGGPPHDGAEDRGADEGADQVADEDRGADEGAGLAVIADPEAYAATEPVRAEDQTPPVERAPVPDEERQWSTGTGADADAGADRGRTAGVDRDADAGADLGADAGADVARDEDAGADHGADAGADVGSGTTQSGDMAIIANPDEYAATEPVSATGDRATTDRDDRDDLADPGAHAPAETGAAVAENDESTRTAADDAERTTEGRYDTTPDRDWAADEGELLGQTQDRGDRLADERQDLARDAGTPIDGTAQRAARRVSEFAELRDGGFGVGSAAPLDDGAQPLDHPVQGHRDSKTYHLPGDPGYDTAEPDVWFYDESAAERSGFRRSGR